ncbi:tetrahydromethanopterin S-methyltransferase subunit F [Sphingomonas prati]|uniref:Tetrahydromethanopterin S-methyltransferase subunit F n=1 Tax=Sphingomonas prati TaxID=1843237 RepID=A0A7W9BTM5_9SPHN|nr:hypothetical protein [Sphingomonas prati]MBB5729729.1 tetrahydromethanopterin S-methyltransferase subunit F [Sphingomonas prati]
MAQAQTDFRVGTSGATAGDRPSGMFQGLALATIFSIVLWSVLILMIMHYA